MATRLRQWSRFSGRILAVAVLIGTILPAGTEAVLHLPVQVDLGTPTPVPSGRMMYQELQPIVAGDPAAHPAQAMFWGRRLPLDQVPAEVIARVPYVSGTVAQRIATHLEEYGPPAQWQALTEIKGVGPKTVVRLQAVFELPEVVR